MLKEPGGLKIVAVGSVMTLGWDLLKEGVKYDSVAVDVPPC